MSDYRFGDEYKLSIYPKEAMGYGGELDMDKVESVEIEWVDFVRKPDDKSRWHELFGTPERAARTLARMCAIGDGSCAGCPMYKANLEHCKSDYTHLKSIVEWLRGDAE